MQSDSIDLASAQVTVTMDGADQPVTVTQLDANYGSRCAIRFNPMGWRTQAGKTYSVSVTGIAAPIGYDVQVVSSCSGRAGPVPPSTGPSSSA